jgi:TPR repeat protein
LTSFLLAIPLAACGTYYDPGDIYTRGLRWFDRGNYEQARLDWEGLAKTGDCDAQYRLGVLYFLGAGVPQDFAEARKHWLIAANQGQGFAQYFYQHACAKSANRLRARLRGRQGPGRGGEVVGLVRAFFCL